MRRPANFGSCHNVIWAAFAIAAFAMQNVTIIVCVSLGFQKVFKFERSRAFDAGNGTATRALDTLWQIGLPPISFSGVFLPERYIFSVGFVTSACCMAVVVARLYAVLVHQIKFFPHENHFCCACCRGEAGVSSSSVVRSGSVDGDDFVIELLEPTGTDFNDARIATVEPHRVPPERHHWHCCLKCVCAVYSWTLCGCIPLRCHNVISLVVSLVALFGLAGLGAISLLTAEGARYWGTPIHGAFAACFFFGLIVEEGVLLTLLLRLRRLRRGGCGMCGSRRPHSASTQRALSERLEASCLCAKLVLALALPCVALVVWGCMAATLISVDVDHERRNTSAAELRFATNSAMAEVQSYSAVLQWSSITLLQFFYISAFFEYVTMADTLPRTSAHVIGTHVIGS